MSDMCTPRPWHVERSLGRFELWEKDHGHTHTAVGSVARAADAALICSAVNTHGKLVEALRECVEWLRVDCAIEAHPKTHGPSDALRMASEVLKKVEGNHDPNQDQS